MRASSGMRTRSFAARSTALPLSLCASWLACSSVLTVSSAAILLAVISLGPMS